MPETALQIDLQTTWQDSDGRLWLVDHRARGDVYVLRPDWPGTLSHPPNREVSAGDLLSLWQPIETRDQRFARRKAEPRRRCALGRHDDPDNSGQCIYCGAVLDDISVD